MYFFFSARLQMERAQKVERIGAYSGRLVLALQVRLWFDDLQSRP